MAVVVIHAVEYPIENNDARKWFEVSYEREYSFDASMLKYECTKEI